MRSVQTARADDVTVSLAADVAEAVASPTPETARSGGLSTGHPRLLTDSSGPILPAAETPVDGRIPEWCAVIYSHRWGLLDAEHEEPTSGS